MIASPELHQTQYKVRPDYSETSLHGFIGLEFRGGTGNMGGRQDWERRLLRFARRMEISDAHGLRDRTEPEGLFRRQNGR